MSAQPPLPASPPAAPAAAPLRIKHLTLTDFRAFPGPTPARFDLDGKNLLERAMAGRRMAELKLAHFGPLPDTMKREDIYSDLV